MGTDIIIALANDSRFNYAELRYALRSIEKNLTGYRDIYLIGEKPGWVQNVIHIKQKDTSRKQYSIYNKFMTAAKTESVSKNFLRWDDDVYLLEKMHVDDVKDWHGGTLAHWSHLNINMMYRNVIRNTLKLFPEGYYYDIHAPRRFNKLKYQQLVKYPWGTQELLTKSTYFNSVESNPVEMKDPKRHRELFMSTSGKIGQEDGKLLRDLFSKPCKYETDYKALSNTASSLAQTSG